MTLRRTVTIDGVRPSIKSRGFAKRYNSSKRRVNSASKKDAGYAALTDKTTLGFPDVVRTKMRYFDQGILINPTVGNTSVHVFRLNSLFDFDFTGTGHKPRGYDQYEVSHVLSV